MTQGRLYTSFVVDGHICLILCQTRCVLSVLGIGSVEAPVVVQLMNTPLSVPFRTVFGKYRFTLYSFVLIVGKAQNGGCYALRDSCCRIHVESPLQYMDVSLIMPGFFDGLKVTGSNYVK